MNDTTQDAQTFVSKTAVGYQIHLTTDGVISEHVLTLIQPGNLIGTQSELKETEMQAIAIAVANTLARIKGR
jgi:hypothetical protein